jgi:hypothetical protein
VPYTAYQYCDGAERYEVNLLGSRLGALLSSQSFLFIGWAALNNSGVTHATSILLIIVPTVALVICAYAYRSVNASIRVIHCWRKRTYRLLKRVKDEPNEGPCRHYRLRRAPIDTLHRVGVDEFAVVVPVSFLVIWSAVLVSSIVRVTLEPLSIAAGWEVFDFSSRLLHHDAIDSVGILDELSAGSVPQSSSVSSSSGMPHSLSCSGVANLCRATWIISRKSMPSIRSGAMKARIGMNWYLTDQLRLMLNYSYSVQVPADDFLQTPNRKRSAQQSTYLAYVA